MTLLDGNAAAGVLSEVFVAEATAAVARCAGCARESAVGELVLYAHGMGAVLRCPHCERVMLQVSMASGARWLDARGCSFLRFPEARA